MEKYAPQIGIQSLGQGAIEQKERDSGISRGSENRKVVPNHAVKFRM